MIGREELTRIASARLAERRAYTSGRPNAAVDSDSDLIEQLIAHVDSLSFANKALRELVDDLRNSRALEFSDRTTPAAQPRPKKEPTP